MTNTRRTPNEVAPTKKNQIFGGAHLKNSNAKVKRPISTRHCMHVVLRSSMATGARSLLKREKDIHDLVVTQGKKHGLKIHMQANGGDHLHLLVVPRSRDAFNGFVRAISGLIPRLILDVERGRSKGLKFWDQRPFSQIIEGRRELQDLKRYLQQTKLQASGFHQPKAKKV